MALWFLNFSTWDGVAGIYVEDLFVWPRFRRRGLARGLLSTLARECVDNRYTRLAWSVLNWNSDAIALYDRIGGQPQHEWTIYRLSGPRLAALAAPRGSRPAAQRIEGGLNSNTSTPSAMIPTGIPIAG